MLHRFLATTGATAMMLANAAQGQNAGDPIVVGEEEELTWFSLEDIRFILDLSTRYREETTRRGGERRSDRDLEFRESLTLGARGFAGHPNLLEWDLMGRFTPTQRHTDRDSIARTGLTETDLLLREFPGERFERRAWEFEYITEYDALARILQESALPLTLFSNRSQTILSRPFGETFDNIVTEHGALAAWRGERMPGSIRYSRRDHETRTRTGLFDYRLVQDSVRFQNRFQITPRQDLTIDYTFDDVKQTGPFRSPRTSRRHDALVAHNLAFGADGQHSLRSELHFFDESGTFDLRRTRLFERLRLRHSDRLESRYDYTFDWVQRPDTDQILHRGQAGFQHRLFDSLITTANVGASHLALSGQNFTSTEGFGDIDFQYTKQVPYGRLSSSASFRYSHRQDSDSNGDVQIVNEPHTFSAAGLIVLQRRLIDTGSIRITDATGTFLFSPGIDYSVHDFVDRVEIRRLIGGNIQDGQTVLISYRFGDEPGRTTDTFSMRYTLRYDFEEGFLRGLGVYGHYFQQDQWRSDDMNLFLPPADIREIVYGADYRIGNLMLLAERTHHDSTLSPFRSTRLEGRYSQPLGRGSSLLLTGTWLDIDRYEDNIRTRITTVSGRWNQQLTDSLHMSLEARWRDERDTARFNVQGIEQQLDLTWRHRQTSVYGSVRNAWLDSDIGRSHFLGVFVGVRREF